MVFVYHVTFTDHVIKVLYELLVYGLEHLKVSHHPTKFSNHKHCFSGYITVLTCRVTSQGYVIKQSCDFIDRCPFR